MPDIFISDIEREEKPKESQPQPDIIEKSKDHSHNPLSAFMFRPKNIDFEARDKDEKIVLVLRRHPITNLGWALIALLMILVPSILSQLKVLGLLPFNFRFIAVFVWYLITSAYILQNFMNWFFNVQIITDERIVDIDFTNLIYKEVSDANIDKVQDVTYKMGGVVRTIFNFGDVLIQTAGEVPNFEFEAVPKPNQVAKILQDLRLEEAQEAVEGRIR